MNIRVVAQADRSFREKLQSKTLKIGVVGLGYVGLPLVHTFWRAGIATLGFDIDPEKIEKIAKSESYIRHFPQARLAAMNASGTFAATSNPARLAEVDAILVCVPTPVTVTREPDLRFVVATSEAIARILRPGMLIVLESTTYPGTTEEIVLPILETSGLKAGKDFHLAFSPEREDPGRDIETRDIPKIVGGIDTQSGDLAQQTYELAFSKVHAVTDAKTAEAVKITENVFRAVNIALVNELKLAYSKMGIDIWDVIEAAKTKPFGFMPFYPGPGLGGHCIPIDPFYLSWRARAFDVDTRFIELAGEVNRAMPRHVVEVLRDSLSERFGKALKGARVLVCGIAYKKNVDDLRESPALRIIEMLQAHGAEVSYFDPYIPAIPMTREHSKLYGMESVVFDQKTLEGFDGTVITTDHSGVDYDGLVRWSPLTIDTRNATRNGNRAKVVLA